MKLCIALGLLIFTACGYLQAAPEKKDPIDSTMQKEIDKNSSTAGMTQATEKANNKWLKEMKIALEKLKKIMSPEQWKALDASQQAWQAFHDKEVETQGAIFHSLHGTMWVPIAASSRMDINKDRVLALRGYIETLSER